MNYLDKPSLCWINCLGFRLDFFAVRGRIFIAFYLLFLFSKSHGQTYSISYSQIEVVSYSIKYSYSNNGSYDYQAGNYYSSEEMLATLEARYNYNRKLVTNEWGKLKQCVLINQYNKQGLYAHQTAVDKYFEENNAALSTVDWAQNGKLAMELVTYISSIYNNKGIKAELQILHNINAEYYRIKNKNPDDFYKSDRYYELAYVLKSLETCSVSEISELAFKYGLL